jgi:hypothetical protein
MVLAHGNHVQTVDLYLSAGLQCDKTDSGLAGIERSWEEGLILLPPERMFSVGMAGVNYDFGVLIERRQERGETHDMVQMHMGQKKVVLFPAPKLAPSRGVTAKPQQSTAHITNEMSVVATIDLDATGGASVASSCRKIEFMINEPVGLFAIGKAFSPGSQKHGDDLISNLIRGRCYWQRPARPPEPHYHRIACPLGIQLPPPFVSGSASSMANNRS